MAAQSSVAMLRGQTRQSKRISLKELQSNGLWKIVNFTIRSECSAHRSLKITDTQMHTTVAVFLSGKHKSSCFFTHSVGSASCG